MQCSVIKSSACDDVGITQLCFVRGSWCRDISFWAERQKEQQFKLDEEYLRQFLPLESVLQGLFNVRGSYGRQLSGLNEDVEVA
jgi:Zn-dependent oligopeptidase